MRSVRLVTSFQSVLHYGDKNGPTCAYMSSAWTLSKKSCVQSYWSFGCSQLHVPAVALLQVHPAAITCIVGESIVVKSLGYFWLTHTNVTEDVFETGTNAAAIHVYSGYVQINVVFEALFHQLIEQCTHTHTLSHTLKHSHTHTHTHTHTQTHTHTHTHTNSFVQLTLWRHTIQSHSKSNFP
jgi:hypothetical protein